MKPLMMVAHHVGQPQVLDHRHSERVPFTGREVDIRLGADGQQPAFPSATACFKAGLPVLPKKSFQKRWKEL